MSPKGIALAPQRPRIAAHLRRALPAVLAAAALLALSACGEAATGTLNTRAGYTVSADEGMVSICPADDESRFQGDEGLLRGAHFALRVECVASFDEVPEGYQLEYLVGEDDPIEYSPPEGYEFTLVQFAPDTGAEAPYAVDDLTELTATLAIGDESWDFEGSVPAAGSAYLAVTKKDAPVTLEVTDSERTQTMDLRARTGEGLISGLYYGSTDTVASDVVENSVDGYTTSGGYEYWFDDWQYSTQFTCAREVYRPGEGWVAENDRVLLSISFGWLYSGSGLEWDIDPEEALKVYGPDGERLTATSVEHVDSELDNGTWRTFYLEFDMPADALVFTLKYHPDGPVSWPEEGVSIPITGDKTHELTISFE